MLLKKGNKLVWRFGNETLMIEPWLKSSFRVRSTMYPDFKSENNALLSVDPVTPDKITISEDGVGEIVNGKIKATIDIRGKVCFTNQKGEILLEEYQRVRNDSFEEGVVAEKLELFNSALNIKPREFKPIIGGDYTLTVRFEANKDEKIFGMGQYQQDFLDLKHCRLELAHRNSQASIPFAVSNKGYGFLWNNPAIGEVTFGKNITEWKAHSTKELDYWITAGDTPSEIVEKYADATGKVPMMPEYGMGFWQSKLRYQTQEELLAAAREYKRRGLPIDVIVCDYYHWPLAGDFKFDSKYWPDPQKMIEELEEMGIKLMVSIWPTIDHNSENYPKMLERGLLVQTERGVPITMDFLGNNVFMDPTNPETREYIWDIIKENYYDHGIQIFWLDEAEPEYTVYDFDNYRYYEGSNLQVGNLYPLMYSKLFYDGLKKEGHTDIINLVRCAWAGSQRYGALVWSGDIDSSFESLRNQVAIGLNMAMAGIPWWTTDIGGFHGGLNTDESFRECLIRWFQFGVFSPVFRMHGDREPHTLPLSKEGGGRMPSGAGTEVWEYGDEAYKILTKYMFLRENLRPYIRKLMENAHKKGSPIIRPMFYNFPQDKIAWEVEDSYMFGDDLLISPVLYEGQTEKRIYLPVSTDWVDVYSGEEYSGGQEVLVTLSIEKIPVFVRVEKKEEFLPLFKDFN